MVTYTAALNGSGPFHVDLTISTGVADIPNNTTPVSWWTYIRLSENGWATWSGDTQYWSANIGGVYREGTFTFDFRPGTAKSILVASGIATIAHNADGTKTITSSTTLDTNHGSVGDGTASGTLTLTPIARGPRVNVGGTWKTSVAYVRVGGVWKVATPYVRAGGVWKVAGG